MKTGLRSHNTVSCMSANFQFWAREFKKWGL